MMYNVMTIITTARKYGYKSHTGPDLYKLIIRYQSADLNKNSIELFGTPPEHFSFKMLVFTDCSKAGWMDK